MMNASIFKSTAITGIGLITLSLGGTVWAEGCVDPDPKYPITNEPTVFVDPLDPDTYEAPAESIPAPSVTEFDGNLTCESTSGYFGGFIANATGTQTFTSPDGSMQFTVRSYLDNGKAVWNVIHDESLPADVMELRGIDATISASNKGSKGCNTTFGVDAGSGVSAFEKVNGTFVASDLYVCASTTVDSVPVPPPPPPAVVEGCVLADGDVISIYGVTIQCAGVPSGEQRTVFVAKDTEDLDPNDGVLDPVPVPGFGFANAEGVIDFKNVCICNGPGPVDGETGCDPSPLPDDPVTDALPLCSVTDSVPALDLTIQNPYCVTYGGSRRCY
jgi:hypothetical protein